MSRDRITISRRKGQWQVRAGNRRDLDLTDAVKVAVGESAPGTQAKAVKFISRFMNFEHRPGECHNAFITERTLIARPRIEGFLSERGFNTVHDSNRIDLSYYVRHKTKGSVSTLPIQLAALSRLYAELSRMGLRPRCNPLKVDGWHEMLPHHRLELGAAICGGEKAAGKYTGSQFVVSGLAPSPLRIEDPVGLLPRMLQAGADYGWPQSITDLVTIMGDDGNRWADNSPLTALDWAWSSQFGRSIETPNKASDGVRTKQTVLSIESVVQLRKSFDDDPTRPDMATLEALLAASDWAALSQIYLFPSQTGRPHSYHVYNNDYIRPAMEQGNVLIHSKKGSVRATGHRLRPARIQEEADVIYDECNSDAEIEAAEEKLKSDVSIKSDKAFKRYMGDQRDKRALKAKVEHFDKRIARRSTSDLPARPPRTPSRAEQRILKLKDKK